MIQPGTILVPLCLYQKPYAKLRLKKSQRRADLCNPK